MNLNQMVSLLWLDLGLMSVQEYDFCLWSRSGFDVGVVIYICIFLWSGFVLEVLGRIWRWLAGFGGGGVDGVFVGKCFILKIRVFESFSTLNNKTRTHLPLYFIIKKVDTCRTFSGIARSHMTKLRKPVSFVSF